MDEEIARLLALVGAEGRSNQRFETQWYFTTSLPRGVIYTFTEGKKMSVLVGTDRMTWPRRWWNRLMVALGFCPSPFGLLKGSL